MILLVITCLCDAQAVLCSVRWRVFLLLGSFETGDDSLRYGEGNPRIPDRQLRCRSERFLSMDMNSYNWKGECFCYILFGAPEACRSQGKLWMLEGMTRLRFKGRANRRLTYLRF